MGENMFKVGDRVIVAVDKVMDGNARIGLGSIGTVRKNNGYGEVGVAWDENVDGHDLEGSCCHGYGWYVYPTDIELLVDNPEFDIDCDEVLSLCGGVL